MKAIVISALLFFSLRAMSAFSSEIQKSDCPATRSEGRVVAPKIATAPIPPAPSIVKEVLAQ